MIKRILKLLHKTFISSNNDMNFTEKNELDKYNYNELCELTKRAEENLNLEYGPINIPIAVNCIETVLVYSPFNRPVLALYLKGLLCEIIYSDKENTSKSNCFNDSLNPAYWYRDSIKDSSLFADAYARLGKLYMEGKFVPLNKKKGIALIARSINLGSSIGTFFMSIYHHDGDGVEKNYDKYIELLLKAANLGCSRAMYLLGREYLEGNYVDKDDNKGYLNLELAANKNNKLALYDLGLHYLFNFNINEDLRLAYQKKGREYLIMSANLGHFYAITMVCTIYEDADSSFYSPIDAYMWHYIAHTLSDSHDHFKQKMNEISSKISRQDIKNAQNLAQKKIDTCFYFEII